MQLHQALSSSDKKVYFDQELKNKKSGYFGKTSTRLNFRLDAAMLEKVNGGLFCMPTADEEGHGEPITKSNALELFSKKLE